MPPPTAIPLAPPIAPAVSIAPAQDARALRVLHVVNGEHFSGAERVQSHLGRCLPRQGVAADFVCLKPGKFFRSMVDRQGEWGTCFATPMRSRFDFRAVVQIRDLVRYQSYDLLHAHTPRSALVTSAASQLTGVPWIYHVHSPASRDSARPLANRLNAFVEKFSLPGCAHLITVSESLRLACVVQGFDDHRLTVVHNGVPKSQQLRTTLPSPGGRWTIGMVALMRPRKGLEVALHAIAGLRRRGHDVVLRCIGPFETPAYEATIDALIDQLQIRHGTERIGFTDNVPAELSKLDALVLPSLYGEGLPMVVLEAMAAALPVIATRVEGTPEAITHGVEGLLAEPQDPDSLASAIESLVTGRVDWHSMAAAAARRHASCFSDEAMAAATATVYRQVLQQAHAAQQRS